MYSVYPPAGWAARPGLVGQSLFASQAITSPQHHLLVLILSLCTQVIIVCHRTCGTTTSASTGVRTLRCAGAYPPHIAVGLVKTAGVDAGWWIASFALVSRGHHITLYCARPLQARQCQYSHVPCTSMIIRVKRPQSGHTRFTVISSPSSRPAWLSHAGRQA